MTRHNEKRRKEMAKYVKGQVIKEQTYCKKDDYFTIRFEDGADFSFRFMADLVNRWKVKP
jgi:hypothetical protein